MTGAALMGVDMFLIVLGDSRATTSAVLVR